MGQKRPLTGRADAGNVVQRRGADRLGPLRAVGADGEAVRLVPQPLHEVEHRVVVTQSEGRPTDPVEFLFPRIAVDPLGHANHGDVLDPQFDHDLVHGADLPGAAVDQQEIGPGRGLAVRVFLQKAGEAAGQHLLHHAEVIACGDLVAPDVELAILALLETLGTGHDHRADRVDALDVAVVVDLDPAGRFGQVEGLGQPAQQFGLGRRLGHLAGKALAGVAQGRADQLCLLTPLRHGDLDLAAGLLGQRLGHEIRVVQSVAEQQKLRRLAVGVELADEGLDDLRGVLLAAKARIVVVVAPVLVRPDEEHLHAGLPAFHVKRDDIRLLGGLGVDPLGRLDLGQCPYPVPQGGGALELHRFRGGLHLGGKLFLHRRGLAREEPRGVADEAGILLFRDVTHARRAAALDLVEQARPRAAFERGVRAVPQQEDLLQLVQRPVHGTGAGEGTVVVALLGLGAPVLLDLRKRVFPADEDIGERLVVAQQHVVARLELLDEVLLQEQGLGLGPGREEHHRRRFEDHPGDPRRMPAKTCVVRHARFQVPRLADVEHPVLGIEHPVDTGAAIQRPQVGLDDAGPGADRVANASVFACHAFLTILPRSA